MSVQTCLNSCSCTCASNLARLITIYALAYNSSRISAYLHFYCHLWVACTFPSQVFINLENKSSCCDLSYLSFYLYIRFIYQTNNLKFVLWGFGVLVFWAPHAMCFQHHNGRSNQKNLTRPSAHVIKHINTIF